MKAFATLLLALLCMQVQAQQPMGFEVGDDFEGWTLHYADGRALIKRDSLYGFVDRNGHEAIPCRYRRAYDFNDGIAMVRHGFEVFAIDTLGNRLAHKVRIPKFNNQAPETFVPWVQRHIPFASSDEFARLRNQTVRVVVTIGTDGRIKNCEKTGISTAEAFEKVCRAILDAPAWTPGEVDSTPRELRYAFAVELARAYPPRCWPIDATGNRIGQDFIYPLFEGGNANDFYGWFFRNLRYKSSLDYQRASSGAVRAAFTVGTKGEVRDIEILSSHNDVCRERTVATIRKSPRWTPGTLDGKPVAVRYEITFYFKYR